MLVFYEPPVFKSFTIYKTDKSMSAIDMGIFRLYANVEVNENHLLSIPVRP